LNSKAGIRLCRLEEIPDGDARGFDPFLQGHDTMLVVRQGGTLHAWRDSCPHIDGVPMAWRKNAYLNAGRDRIVCSAHGAVFDIATGICTLGPCVGQSLKPLTVELRADGSIYLETS
jgi:nitrite reductase/ring-hydroxylating ferredoxin subunit